MALRKNLVTPGCQRGFIDLPRRRKEAEVEAGVEQSSSAGQAAIQQIPTEIG